MPIHIRAARSITFTIPGNSGYSSVQVTATEDGSGKIVFVIDVLNTSSHTEDIKGLFFNFVDDAKLEGLTGAGPKVINFDTVDVINDSSKNHEAGLFDIGVKFGVPDKGNDPTIFTLSNTESNLTLDDIAHVQFQFSAGPVNTSNGKGTHSSKLVTAPAASNANDDAYDIFEDGQNGLNDPSTVHEGRVFQVLDNDTDADGDKLTIIAVRGADHGHIKIVDGADADHMPGDAVLYIPDADYSGDDDFKYIISDNHGSTDFATVNVSIAAVADIPALRYEIIDGETADQVIVKVTTNQTDADSSEFIDRIELSGIPPTGVTVDPNGYNPTEESDLIENEFRFILPLGQDTQFNLGITAVSKETSNGDEETSSQTLDMITDTHSIFEDGQAGPESPSHDPIGTYFEAPANNALVTSNTRTINIIHGVSHGSLEIVDGANAAIVYTPDADYSGTDSFAYTISDIVGGTDFVMTSVSIDAIADTPDLTYEILKGDLVNQIIVRVTTAETDADNSEFIDRIELDGIPENITVSESLYNPTEESDQIVRDFVLTFPTDAATAFDLTITAVSKEESNGDEESASQSVDIGYGYNQNLFYPVFEAEDQSMWASDNEWSFTDDRFLGAEGSIDGRESASIDIASAYADYDIDYKIGLQSTLNIGSGEVDATVPYAVEVQTFYNEATDWLHFETDATVDILNSVFSTQSPLLTYTLDLIAELQSALQFGASVDIPGTPDIVVPPLVIGGITIIPGFTIPGIPGFSMDAESGTYDFGISESPNLLAFDGDSLNLMGFEGDSKVSIDLEDLLGDSGKGFFIEAEIPHFDTESTIVGNHLESEGSATFFSLNADVDALLTKLLAPPGIPNIFAQEVTFEGVTVGYDLLNYLLAGSLGLGQEFSMSFGNLNGVLKFEDDAEYSFVLGQDFDVLNASSHDINNDGIIDFELLLEPDATFSSNLLLTMELTHSLELLTAKLSIDVPVFDDPEFSIGPVYSYEGPLADTSIELVGFPGFSFDLGSTTEHFVV
jgi:hypothetical protein